MSYITVAYVLYLLITLGVTVWVAQTLSKNGQLLLDDIFHGNHALAKSVNHLLVVGFYLVNLGYSVYTMHVLGEPDTMAKMLQQLSMRVGFIILVLGGVHFFNLFVLFRLRKRAKDEEGYTV